VIPRANITAWRKTAPWPDDSHVEQDLVLSRALVELFNRRALRAARQRGEVCAGGARFFTNGTFHEESRELGSNVTQGPGWNPVTEATFDTGVIVVAKRSAACLWVEDED